MYSNAGGGGERVLWCAIEAIEAWSISTGTRVVCLIYTESINNTSPDNIMKKVRDRFGIDYNGVVSIRFITLTLCHYVKAKRVKY